MQGVMRRNSSCWWFGSCALSGALAGCDLLDGAREPADFRFGVEIDVLPVSWTESDDGGSTTANAPCSSAPFDMGGGCEDTGTATGDATGDVTGESASTSGEATASG